ncbi:MAG: hypothetical protein QNJ49_17070 [Mastigocoleus sp. MO_167.B18]|nr:hypothetical protein [Mastigocoleus sp. MO_167.B18]
MQNSRKRMMICSFCAVTCGLFGSFIGWQIASSLPSQRCRNQTWEIGKIMCNLQTSPESMYKGWQGSTSGVWTGTILGAFFAGLGTRQLRR